MIPLETEVHGTHVDVNLQLFAPRRPGISRPDLQSVPSAHQRHAVGPQMSHQSPGRSPLCGLASKRDTRMGRSSLVSQAPQCALCECGKATTWLEKSFLLDLPPISSLLSPPPSQ